jgi:hypothetical protein
MGKAIARLPLFAALVWLIARPVLSTTAEAGLVLVADALGASTFEENISGYCVEKHQDAWPFSCQQQNPALSCAASAENSGMGSSSPAPTTAPQIGLVSSHVDCLSDEAFARFLGQNAVSLPASPVSDLFHPPRPAMSIVRA